MGRDTRPPGPGRERTALPGALPAAQGDGVDPVENAGADCHLHCRRDNLAEVCAWLFCDLGYAFAS